jgi:hypothetical protein
LALRVRTPSYFDMASHPEVARWDVLE